MAKKAPKRMMSSGLPVLSARIAHTLGAIILVAVMMARISPTWRELKPLPSRNIAKKGEIKPSSAK